VLICLLTSSISQEKQLISKEMNWEMYFLSVRAGEVTYERLINEESGLEFHCFFVREDLTQFSLTPYYRSYFEKKQRLAFVEGLE
jgi:hypothetical protein